MAVIKLTNNVRISQESLEGLTGIDTSNVIASSVNPYTATEDCFAMCWCFHNAGSNIYIDDVLVGALVSVSDRSVYEMFEVKKGQKIRTNNTYGAYGQAGIPSVFGLKK